MEIGWRLVSPRSQQELEMSVLFECACASQTLVTHRRSITQPSLQKFLAGKHSSEFEGWFSSPASGSLSRRGARIGAMSSTLSLPQDHLHTQHKPFMQFIGRWPCTQDCASIKKNKLQQRACKAKREFLRGWHKRRQNMRFCGFSVQSELDCSN